MKKVWESVGLPPELAGWAWRGLLCAASSLYWAVVAGFNAPPEFAGMAAGIAGWVVVLAGFCVWHGQAPRRGPERLVPALKLAALIKFGFSALGWVIFAACALFKDARVILDHGMLAVMPDCMLGMISLWLVSLVSGVKEIQQVNSFGWTALITLVDGALFMIVIGAFATVVLSWWRFAPLIMPKLKISPTRTAG